MNETITLAEAILVSIVTVVGWAAIKTILEMLEERSNYRKRQNS
jgi:hypothetical protein